MPLSDLYPFLYVPEMPETPVSYTGRVLAHEGEVLIVFLDASRWHGASIAGLVVGAMGCFIFGLYLRAWLRERKALASQPGQDMIA